MDAINVFKYLQLHLISDDWVQQVWDSDFMELEELSTEYEEFLMENDVLNVLETLIKALRTYLDSDKRSVTVESIKDDPSLSWEFLVENKVEHKNLLAILTYFMVNGQKSSDMKSLELCYKATSLYCLLVALPGCDAFYVFQPSIYEKTLKTLSTSSMLNEMKPSSQNKSRRKTNDENDENEENIDDDDDDCETSFRSLSSQSKTHIRRYLNIILKDLYYMIKHYPLKVEDSLEKTIIQLVSHTRLVNSLSFSDFGTLRVNGDISCFVCNSYTLLRKLCVSLHGKEKETVRLIFYHLLSNILMAGEFFKDFSMHQLNIIRLQTEKFILYLQKCLEDKTHSSICIFIQHLCARVIDKADFRLKVSQSIVSLLNVLPSEPYFRTIKWLLRFAHDVKASHRLFALEVISKLMYEDERPNDVNERKESIASRHRLSECGEEMMLEDEETVRDSNRDTSSQNDTDNPQVERDVASHKYLLGVLFSRCHDQSGTVRTKALSTLTDCLRTNNNVVMELMKEIFVMPYEDNDLIDNDNIVERGFLNTKIFLESLDKPVHVQADPLPGGKAVVIELLNLVEDDKVFVRKSAFSLLEYIVRLNHKWLTEKLLKVICDHVRDPALLIKKQLIQSLTDLLLMYPEDERLAKYYIDAVLPQISHPELKVQEKVLEALHSTILQRLVPFEKLNSSLTYLPWSLLQIIIDLRKRKFFQITCSIWSKNNMFPKSLLSLIKTYINTEHNVAAWLLLSCVAPYIPIKNPEFVVEYYRENLTNSNKPIRYAVVKALDVLGHAWKHLPAEEQNTVRAELLESVQKMSLSTTLIGPVLDILLLMTLGKASNVKAGQKEVIEWSKNIFTKIEEYFQKNSPLQSDAKRVNMEEFMRNLVTLGDVAQLCPGHVPNNIGIILTGILFPEKLHDPVKWSVPGLQALTVVTLGKMCLQNETLAKRIVPAMGLLLTDSKHEAVKVNVMNALSDMCIRFTAVVEPLLPEMCVCLKDENVVVRHHTVAVFVRLLQQDFLKLRGALLFHMMSMLVDPIPNISQLANYFMTQCVVTRNKSIMYQNIVESIFYYNKYENHPAYSKVKLSPREAILFNMAGPDNEQKRHTLYRFMCEHMNDEQRMQAIHKICVDVLGGVSNETVVLDDKGESVLQDAFFILQCEEICLHSLRTQSEDEPATDDAERVTAAVNTAKKNIISQCVKKQVVEIIIPIIMQLKGKLQTVMSPLLTSLMSYLSNILKDYKSEIEDIFAEDKTLAEEILFDMKKFEQEEKNRVQTQDSDEEDGGEVDHMRPLLVELATDHLRKSMRRRDSAAAPPSQSSGVLSPASVEAPVTSPEPRNGKSPSSGGLPSPEVDPNSSEAKSSNADGKSPGGESAGSDPQPSTSRSRRSSVAEKVTNGEEQPAKAVPSGLTTPRANKKRSFEDALLDADTSAGEPRRRRSASIASSRGGSASSRRRTPRARSSESGRASPTPSDEPLAAASERVDGKGDARESSRFPKKTPARQAASPKKEESARARRSASRSRRETSEDRASSRKSSVASESSSSEEEEIVNLITGRKTREEKSKKENKSMKAAKSKKNKR